METGERARMGTSRIGVIAPLRGIAVLALFAFSIAEVRSETETDLYPDPGWLAPDPFSLAEKNEQRAEALARFSHGILLEESQGPERAMESFRRVLDLDPGFLFLSLRMAREHIRRGEIPEAIGVVKDTAKARPEDPLPPLILGEIYLRHLQKPDLAAEFGRQAVQLAPDLFAARELLWEIANYSGQPATAVAELDAALEVDSEDPRFWLQLAELHRRLPTVDGEETEANGERRIQALRNAAEFAGEDTDALVRIADLHVLQGEIDLATPSYRAAYELDPAFQNLAEKFAACLVELREFEEAIPLLETMLERNPRNLPVCDQLANIALEQGDYEEAVRYRQRALRIAPKQPERYHDLIALLLERQKTELAIFYLNEAIETFPRSGVFHYLLGATLTRSGEPEKAVLAFQQAVADSPYSKLNYLNGEFYFEYGMAAEQAEMFELAAEMFRKSIDMDPANAARASNYLGYMWVDRNENLEEAESLILRALESEPHNGAYMDSLGWLEFRRGNYSEALVLLLRAAELLPKPDAVVFDHIGDTYQALGRHPEALLYWTKALQLDSESESIAEKIDQLSERIAAKAAPR